MKAKAKVALECENKTRHLRSTQNRGRECFLATLRTIGRSDFIAGQLSDRLGRRKMILISAFVFAVGSIMAGVSPHKGLLFMIFSRIILGLAVGAASALVLS